MSVPPKATPLSLKHLEANRLLALLSREVRQRLVPLLRLTSLKAKQVLYEPNSPINTIYFPLGAVASELSTMANGATVEVATIGKEGMLGIPVLLGGDTISLHVIAQIPGPALAMKREDFERTLNDGANGLSPILLRYTQALLTQIAQHSACNRSHVIEKRCARWILMTHDRVQKPEFPLTHEFLAYLLGARRPSVSIAARTLAKAGLISYTRGSIHVLNRKRLEKASCECYGVIKREYDRLLSSGR
jgi:CRP-like cAMP-binding protein